MADESPRHRLRKGDRVVWVDPADWPPEPHSGVIKAFDNEELTHVVVEFEDEVQTKVLTEDDVKREETT